MSKSTANATLTHDVIVDGAWIKGDDDTKRPHMQSCAGCREQRVCHGCGTPTSAATGRCTSGACPSCCARLHRHPQG